MKRFRLQLNPGTFWLCVALLVCLRCGLTAFQQGYTWVGGAPLDDELMFRAANAVTAGEWLGAYDYLTLSKAMFFPVWLALLHALACPAGPMLTTRFGVGKRQITKSGYQQVTSYLDAKFTRSFIYSESDVIIRADNPGR